MEKRPSSACTGAITSPGPRTLTMAHALMMLTLRNTRRRVLMPWGGSRPAGGAYNVKSIAGDPELTLQQVGPGA